jgi:hypothetical protein
MKAERMDHLVLPGETVENPMKDFFRCFLVGDGQESACYDYSRDDKIKTFHKKH